MVVRSYPDVGSAAEQLAKTAMVWEDRRALTKQSNAMNVQSIAQWMKNNPLLAGSLLGAGGGGLYGLLTSFGREEEDRSPLQSAMTGALGGGLLGLGGGAIYKYGPELYSRYFGDKAEAPALESGGAEILDSLLSGESKIQDIYDAGDIETIERVNAAIASPEGQKRIIGRGQASEGFDLYKAPGYIWSGAKDEIFGGSPSVTPLRLPEGMVISEPLRQGAETLHQLQSGGVAEATSTPGMMGRMKQFTPLNIGLVGASELGLKGIDKLRNPAWADLHAVAGEQKGKGPNLQAMQEIAESPAAAKEVTRAASRFRAPARPAATPPTKSEIHDMLTGKNWTPPPSRPKIPLHTVETPGGQSMEAAQVRAKIREGRKQRTKPPAKTPTTSIIPKKPFSFRGRGARTLGLLSWPALWGAYERGKSLRSQNQQTPSTGSKP